MKRLILTGFSAVILSAAFITSTFAAKPPSGDSNSSDLGNSTVDTSQIIAPHPNHH